MATDSRPLFSIVSAVYNVAPYLPDFIDSIEAQTTGLDDVEVVMVDDGSTDDSSRLLAEWAARRPGTVRVVTQENGGQGAARNRGIQESTGAWITFPDPDDVLEPDYLEVVRDFVRAHPEAHMAATNRLIWNERSGKVSDSHPLRAMFAGSPYVDLSASPDRFHGSSPATFFLLDAIRDADLRFDSRVRPNFEDGHFNCRYLFLFDRPQVGFLQRAKYHYRKREDASSTLQTAGMHPGRYTAVPEHGYLDVIRRGKEAFGELPGWAATFLLYELQWYFSRPDPKAGERPVSGEVPERFHELARQILDEVDVHATSPYLPPSVPPQARLVLEHGYDPEPWVEQEVLLHDLDTTQELVRATYFFTGDLPEEQWLANGRPIEPSHGKVRAWEYYGRTLLRQRVVWLPADVSLRLLRNGEPADFIYRRDPRRVQVAPPGQLRWWLNPESGFARSEIPDMLRQRRPTSRLSKVAARIKDRPAVARRYADAWVFMDRVHDAADSAEILFRYVRENHPEINAWFVLEKGGKEWDRFRAEGHGDRLVAYKSLQWRVLMSHATHLLSSHADAAIVRPWPVLEFTHAKWRFHFLQHGVIKDDLSSWLDPKRIETFVVSTPQELASIAGDDTSYVFTTKEVALTGLPRFDRLQAVGDRFPVDKRDLLLVAPTWRNNLMPPIIEGSQRRDLDLSLLDSYFVKAWMEYLRDDRLAKACREHGVTLGFLPHPNLQPLLPHLDLPAHVTPLSYEGQDPQELFARARAFVTDFSSVAFNAAYLQRPVVYYQFDADLVLGGGHVGRAGYYDYERDGFGPVTASAEDAVQATLDVLAAGPHPTGVYQERIDATFPLRDGRCCERVVERVRLTERDRSDLPPVPTPQA
ncbi:glycosyltransferase involved in cell wall biosynthesis [Nocardioides sp. J9]|uniref:bifunctional glycosyltransferase/CDP-glycerol:glycerophosphate glycerophosphotransferase n=1 Tax=Nocardioides sp. J9 TaxID=935844 RepID=UPI00119E13E2|nr:CDP-glycerol glycerophosphotransferase family protein [Nocardioides sp. J9]TWG90617.1 glycosyltransferase involved in cell wall biosynthesis [Nocardioides sp. J9]